MAEELNQPPLKPLDLSGPQPSPTGEKWEGVKPALRDDHPVADLIVVIGDLICTFLAR